MGYQKCLSGFKTIDLKEMRKRGFLKLIRQSVRSAFDRVSRNNGFKDRNKCPVCNSSSKEKEFSKFGIDIVCCKKCTARYGIKIPVNVEDIYSDEEHLSIMQEGYVKNASYRKERFGKERLSLISQYIVNKKSKRLLDVGCGTGGFLEIAKEQGFDVYGQDLGKKLAAWTSDRLNIKVFDSPINLLPKSLKFDVITVFDVLEHVESPPQFILELKKHLKRNGIIVFFVPHFDSLSSHVMREESNHVCPSEHLTYFTENSIRVLAEKTRLSIKYLKTCGIDLGDLKSYYEWKGEKNLALACEKLYDLIQPVIDEAGAGNSIRCILKKNE